MSRVNRQGAGRAGTCACVEAYAKVGSLGCLTCPHSVGIALESQGRLSYSRSSAGTGESDPCHPGIPTTVRHDFRVDDSSPFYGGFGRLCCARSRLPQALQGAMQPSPARPSDKLPAPAFTNLK